MEQNRCVSSGCLQLPEHSCTCQQPPVLVCTRHLSEHLSVQAEHAHTSITLTLMEEELTAAKLSYKCLATATQQSVSQVLKRVDEDIQHAVTSEELKTLTTESMRLRKELPATMTVERETLEWPYDSGLGPVEWTTENIQSTQLKANFQQQALEQRHESIRTLQSDPKRQPLPEIDLQIDRQDDVEDNIKAFVEQVSVSSIRVIGKDLLNDLQSVLRIITTCGVSVAAMTGNLAGRQVPLYQVYECIVEEFRNRGIRSMTASLDEHGRADLCEQYRHWVGTLAFSALENGIIGFQNSECQNLTTRDVQNLLKWLPIYTEDTNEQPATCHFLHNSIMEYVIAKNIVEDLESAKIGALTPTKLINCYNVVAQHGVRRFIVQMAQQNQKHFERLLLDIVKQTRRRDDITQASANAMTLLNQMEYSFAHQDFKRVKLTGVDLYEACLQGTSFEKADLRQARLTRCNLATANFSEADLRGVQFGQVSLKVDLMEVYSVCFSPDGALVASSGSNVTVWETGTYKEVLTLKHKESFLQQIHAVCFSTDGTLIASAGCEQTVILWDTETGRRVRTLDIEEEVVAMCFSSDGKLFVSACGVFIMLLWRTDTWEKVRVIQHNSWELKTVCFSPNGTLIVSAGQEAVVWETETGEEIRTLTGSFEAVSAACFSPDGGLIAGASEDKTIILWETCTGLHTCTLVSHFSPVKSVCFSPNGALIASGGENGQVIVWETGAGQPLCILRHHNATVRAVCFSPDSAFIVSAGLGGESIVQEIGIEQQVRIQTGHRAAIQSVHCSPDGTLLAASSDDNQIIVWETETSQQLHTLTGFPNCLAVCFSPNGALIASGGSGRIALWDTGTGQQVCTLTGNYHAYKTMCFSPDGAMIAAASGGKMTIGVWETKTDRQIHTLTGHSNYIMSVSFSRDGAVIMSVDESITMIHWETETGQQLRTINRTLWARSICFSLDRSLFASDDGHVITVVETRTGEKLCLLTDEHGRKDQSKVITAVCLSSNGALTASSYRDCRIIIWDTRTAQQVRILPGSFKRVTTLCFSPDDALLFSAGNNSSITVWNTGTWQQLCTLTDYSDGVGSTNSLDGAAIRAIGAEGEVSRGLR